jgi:proliferating cell nuclear antigen
MTSVIFEAKTVQTANIKSLFEVLKDVLIELNMVITKDKIKIVSLSNNEECLIHVKLDASKFEYFYSEHTEENPLVLGVHTDNLYKIVKTIKHDETISFFVTGNEAEKHFLFIKKENNERNSINTFKLQLHNIPKNNYVIDQKYNTTVVMNSNELQKICKDFNSLGNRIIEIKNIGEQIFFTGNGEFSSFELVIGNSNNTSFQNISSDEIIQGRFPMKYLLLFSKASVLSNTVQLRLMNDFPLSMTYEVGNLGEMSFLVSCLE